MRATRYARSLGLSTGIIVLAATLYACKDFLVTPPQGSLDELTMRNKEGIEASLVSAYRMLGGWTSSMNAQFGAASTNWPFGSVTSDDAYKGSDPADQASITDLELYNWGLSGAESYLNDKWRALYEGINRSNATLRLLDIVLDEEPAEISEEDASAIRGEALFLRAHYHFDAWKLWGNIPYFREDDDDFRKSNMGVDAVTEILADFDQAITLLPETPRSGARASAWTARAYKGRVQVYAGDHAGGLETLREVRNSGPYALEPNFHRVWTAFPEFANGPETILAYQATANDGNPNGDNANYGERLNFPHGSPFGCCGFHQPSQNLVNFFVVDDAGLPVALSDPNWNARDENLDATVALPVDPRLDWTVGRDGVPYKDMLAAFPDNGVHVPAWIRDRAYGGPYSPKKNVHEWTSGAASTVGWNPDHLNSMNSHLYRYADLLLLLAEAEVEVGSLENARQIVNEIRSRAGVLAQGRGTEGGPSGNIAVPIDDPSIDWADYRIGLYTTPWTSQEFARAVVRAERRLELAMEGHRFFDLRRWGIAAEVLNEYIATERTRRPYLEGAANFGDRHSLFPIPFVQIELSQVEGEDRLQQNPGW